MIKTVIRLKYPGFFQRYLEEEYLSDDEVLIQPKYGAICKADLRYFYGLRPQEVLQHKLPSALIHEATAIVLYDPLGKIATGQAVIPVPNTPCTAETADDWYTSNYALDTQFRSSGYDGYAQNLLAHRRDLLVPYESSFVTNGSLSVFAELISVAVHALHRALHFPTKREVVAVWGDGLVGYITSLVIKKLLPESKLVCIIKHPERADYFYHADDLLITGAILKHFSCDLAFECVGGNASETALKEILVYLEPNGIGVLTGVTEGTVPIETRMVLDKGLTFLGSSRSTQLDFSAAVPLLQDPWFAGKLEQVITDIYVIRDESDLEKAFRTAGGTSFGKVLLEFAF